MDDKQQPSPNNSATASASDDLKLINGIGPTIEQRLNEAGIRAFTQLAALSPQALIDLVDNVTNMSLARIERQDWIGQAATLAAEAPADDTAVLQAATGDRQHNETFTVSLLLDETNQVRRTRVAHVQDSSEGIWPGWQETRLKQFIVTQAGLHLAPESAPDLYGEPDLTKLQIVVGGNGSGTGHVLHQSQRFTIHLSLNLSQIVAPPNAELECTVIVYAKNIGDGASQIVGAASNTISSTDDMVALETVGQAIPPGIYRPEALIVLSLRADGCGLTTRLVGSDLFQVF
ncbi:MAG TPA: hypothetical protein VGD99_26160 [Anaerolineae bacterium]